jgi:non-ribosomal peptide synthetase component E (peptide arylation enzyme)
VPPGLVRNFAPLLANGNVSQLWGMTELQAGLYTRPADPIELVAISAGRASPGTEIRIANEDGAPVPTGEIGEIQVRGPSVFTGYYNNPDATAAAFTADGWFRSGDLATMDASGNVSLSGRLKDVINRGGVKYNPQEIELLVEHHPSVAQCAIAPIPNGILGEQACCYVLLRPGAQLTFHELSAFLLGFGIAKYKLPEKLEILTEFPLTATRKIIKARLRPKASDKSE